MNSTTHPVAPEEIMAHLDGELSAERAQFVTSHLESCQQCSVVAANLGVLSHQMRVWEVGQLPASVSPKFEQTSTKVFGDTKFGISGFSKWRFFSSTNVWKGVVATIAICLLLAAISIPNLLRSKSAANESNAVGELRTLNTAVAQYSHDYGHVPPALKNLGKTQDGSPSADGADLIDKPLADGRKSGYVFTYEQNGSNGYKINAEPIEPGKSGQRRFSTDQNGLIRPVGDNILGSETFTASTTTKKITADAEHEIPMIARTVSLVIVSKDFSVSRVALDTILAKYDGYSATLTINNEQSTSRSLEASLRIPASHLASAVTDLKKLGQVQSESQNGEEVTQQHADLVARLKNSRETEQRLQAILAQRTGKIGDVLQVEQEIARVRGEIEQMEAEQQSVEHRVNFATIELKLDEEYKAQLNSPSPAIVTQFRNSFVNGARSAFDTLLSILLFFAGAGPSLLLWVAILFLPARFVWRRFHRALLTSTSIGG